ncbi:conserved hypothetical protein [Ricinus communis]|uniref:Uncharacterized protein n=1 Tax=Ricinus communis TaxID=3988 RepID=B9RJ24_RICCO|nr:conserved hypothetical protein [Ricinus communis]
MNLCQDTFPSIHPPFPFKQTQHQVYIILTEILLLRLHLLLLLLSPVTTNTATHQSINQ